MSDEIDKLKPCPFCGKAARSYEAYGDHYIDCVCDIAGLSAANESDAIRIWNTRAESCYRCNAHRRNRTRRVDENCVECAYDEGLREGGLKVAALKVATVRSIETEALNQALREVRDAIDATYEASVSLQDFDKKAVRRLDNILALFRAGGKFSVEESSGEATST